jgi:hypothetical protein
VDAEKCLNLYPEMVEGQGKSQYALYPTPGLALLATAGTSEPVDAMVSAINPTNGDQRIFAISGVGFYEVTVIFGVGASFVLRGTLSSNVFHQPSMTSGADYILVAVDGNAYYFTLSTNTFSSVSINGQTIGQVGYCDGFFLATVYRTNTIYASSPLDATTWPSLSLAQISVFPDPITNMVVNQRQVWFFGSTASVVYYDSGNSPFPFDVIQGSYIEQGCVSSFQQGQFLQPTAVKLDNSIFWIGNDPRGSSMVWRANGYTPQRVSTHAVEFAFQGYPTVDDAFLYTYQDQGHSFLVCYLPSANAGNGATWVYDVATGFWHERAYLDPSTGKLFAHRSKCHVYGNGTGAGAGQGHLVGDWQSTGNLYEMKIPTSTIGAGPPPEENAVYWDFATDFGNPIQRLRRSPYIATEKEWIVHREFQLDMETGLGPVPGIPGPYPFPVSVILQDFTDPTAMWKVEIGNDGIFVIASVTSGVPQPLILNFEGNSYQIFVNGGAMQPVQVPFLASYPVTFPMATNPGLLQSAIVIEEGFVPGPNITTITPQTYYRGPLVQLRWSDDSGHTWKSRFFRDAGAAGKYMLRIRYSRLGRSRQRIYEVSWSEAVPLRIVDAYVKADPEFTPQKRLVKKLAETA